MKTIPLTMGVAAIVDDEDYDRIVAMGKWCASKRPHTFYGIRAVRRDDGTRTSRHMHAAITGWDFVDHIDGNGLNNTRGNLRPADRAQNSCNSRRRTDNKSGYRGVSWSRTNDKWRAVIHRYGKRTHLGYYATADEAARAYDDAAREMHGAFATLNFGTGARR